MFDIIAIGSTTYDSYFKVKFQTVDWETPSKKAYVIPTGEKFGVDDAYFTMGGNAANASVTFARQGFKAAIITRIGNDAAARDIKERLQKEGVETSFISEAETPTAHGVLLLENGERTILSYRGAIDEFSVSDIDWSRLRSKWIYVSLPGNSYKILREIIKHAKQNNIKIALNPSSKHLSEGREELVRDIKNVDVLVLNEGEAAVLAGVSFTKDNLVFERLDEMTPGIAVVTDGAKGVKVSDGKFIYEAGTFGEKETVDRTGAGDAFGSGFVAGLLRQEKLIESGKAEEAIKYAIRLASANATSNIEYIGATEGMLTKDQFENDPRWQSFEIKIRPVSKN